ncbi:MAG: hypothetical protein P1U64_11885 [Alcanivoracaceae bacterium]|nr:hypothetical protein [Alcanivoracaceae bacterium]
MKTNVPDIDAPCGDYFTFHDFVACSDTYKRLMASGGIDNVPREPETYQSMQRMARDILDPVRRHFDSEIILTYGFSGPSLVKALRQTPYPNITQDRDQHAGSELSRNGNLRCKRRGIAVDFYVAGISSWDVACWVIENTPFDRLYFYSAHRPFHVSVGPEENREIVVMRGYRGGPHTPARTSKSRFLAEPPA